MFSIYNFYKKVTCLFETKEVNRENLPFTPFCHHTWRGVTEPPDFFFFSDSANNFLDTFMFLGSKYVMVEMVICADPTEIILMYNNSTSNLSFVTDKMAVTAISVLLSETQFPLLTSLFEIFKNPMHQICRCTHAHGQWG